MNRRDLCFTSDDNGDVWGIISVSILSCEHRFPHVLQGLWGVCCLIQKGQSVYGIQNGLLVSVCVQLELRFHIVSCKRTEFV